MNKEPTSLPDTMLDDVPLYKKPGDPHLNRRPLRPNHWTDEKRLWNTTQNHHAILQERPQHVQMATMAANGYTSGEIAKHLGYTSRQVGKVLSMDFAQERVIKIANENAREEIKKFLEKETMPSLQVIRDLRDNPQVAPAVRGSMANLLVERFLGKAVQPIDPNAKPVSEMKDEDLKADVESILQQTRVN